MTEAILRQYLACPPHEARRVAAHTAERGSGHVGRTAQRRARYIETGYKRLNRVLRNLRHHEGLTVFPLRKRVGLVREMVDESFLLRIEGDPRPKHRRRRI
jgi:hypothetical protein